MNNEAEEWIVELTNRQLEEITAGEMDISSPLLLRYSMSTGGVNPPETLTL